MCSNLNMPPVLGYWKIRGLAQPIRYLLHYVGEEFEDKLYECGGAPDYSRACWTDEKFSHGLDFPNLPYYIDKDVKLSQSNTIIRYLSRKHKLDGSTERERIRVDLMTDEAYDFRFSLGGLCYGPDYTETKRAEHFKNLKPKLQQYEEFIGNYKYFAGDNITYVDFIMYEPLDQMRVMEPGCLGDYPKLSAFLDRFENLPAIKKYMASDKFFKRPFNNPMAGFQ